MQSNKYELIVVVRVNTECALRCSFCGYSRDLNRPAKTIDDNKLKEFGKILQQQQSARNQRVLVSWLGGEPFQWRQWRETSLAFRELGIALGITTNGIALCSEQVRSDALQLFDQITISIDGLAESHNRMRQSPGLFERLRRVVGSLNERRSNSQPWLRVNTILTKHNVASFHVFCETMADWGFDEMTFNQLGGNDRPEYFPNNRLSPDQVAKLIDEIPKIQAACQSRGMTLCSSPSYLHRIYESANNREISIEDCSPGEHFLFVDELGNVSPCSFTSQSLGVSLKDLNTPAKLNALDRMFREKRCGTMPTCCKDCHATHVFAKFAEC